MGQRKNRAVWANLQRSIWEGIENYVSTNNVSVSEFVRTAIIEKLIRESYVTQEVLEDIVISRV
jgi:hypothetical protein